ncbi:hypothetical protein HMPREF0201_03938 [Cedecea davisae DSM 4568]|uniref:Uncharacterized protein n=1 Tax=Cedecea davisae DSM 4568 TaxID=566551 RepID=S3IMR1_9ENTR|nr:hypothetical protein HMPREF0201_03938 [Cedecea davisae DSM 4568]
MFINNKIKICFMGETSSISVNLFLRRNWKISQYFFYSKYRALIRLISHA